MLNFTHLFETILTGDKSSSRLAARQVTKLFHGNYDHKDELNNLSKIIDSAPEVYQTISEDWRQENFVMAVSVFYFIHDHEQSPDFLFPWLFQLLQHKNGYIRHSAVKMLKDDLGPLTVHLRVPGNKYNFLNHISPEKADRILFSLFVNLSNLEQDYRRPAFKKYKYISSLPVGVYKSVQLVLGELRDDCGEEYMRKLRELYQEIEIIADRKNLIKRMKESSIVTQTAFTLAQNRVKQMRRELEQDMLPQIKKLYPSFNFEDLVSQIYDNTFNIKDLGNYIEHLINQEIENIDQHEGLLSLITTIWNIYPHKELEGFSPFEIRAMYEIIQQKDQK